MGRASTDAVTRESTQVHLRDFLSRCREQVLREWERHARSEAEAAPLSRSALRDHIPELLDHLAELVGREDGATSPKLGQLGEFHALERLDAGFDVRTVMRELSAVREVVFRLFKEDAGARGGSIVLDELLRFDQALDEVTSKSVETYARGREAELDRRLASERATRAEAEELLAILQTFAATTPLGFGYFDHDLRYVMVNEPLAKLHGVSSQDHLGKTVGELFPVVADFVEPLLQRILDTGEPMPDVEIQVPSLDEPGQTCYRLVSYTPVKRPNGEVIGVGVVAMDVTARKRAEQQAVRRADFAQELIAIVSHDLRSPINAILLAAGTLLRRKDVEARQVAVLERMKGSAERANRMIGDLLDFTRAQVGAGIPIERKRFDFNEVVGQVLDEIRLAHPERELRTEQGVTGPGEWDPDRLAQVVTNLVTNALKHSPAGTPVRVTTRGDVAQVVFSVWNAGSIPEAERERLFQPYRRGQRANETAPSGGIGLGLYITKQLVDAHHGRIEVVSSEEQGTTFTVTLPRTAVTR